MKLYTEEQVRQAWNVAYIDALAIDNEDYKPKFYDDFIKELTPIELPSDEEIEKQSEYIAHNYFDIHNTNHYQGLKDGSYRMAKWMRDKILNK